eukprot:492778_1
MSFISGYCARCRWFHVESMCACTNGAMVFVPPLELPFTILLSRNGVFASYFGTTSALDAFHGSLYIIPFSVAFDSISCRSFSSFCSSSNSTSIFSSSECASISESHRCDICCDSMQFCLNSNCLFLSFLRFDTLDWIDGLIAA